MIRVFNISSRTFCLLLMIHLLAVNVCHDFILKLLVNSSIIIKILDIEEETDNDLKGKTLESDDLDATYLVNSLNGLTAHHYFQIPQNFLTNAFQYLQITLPQSVAKVLIPPPRV